MTMLSRKKLKKEYQERIYKRFVKDVMKLKTNGETEVFLRELLTPTEMSMLTKRYAVLLLLSHDFSSYKIAKLLNMSETTIARLSRSVEEGRFDYFKKEKKKQYSKVEPDEDFFDFIEKLLMVKKMGKDRWKFLDELYGKD
ncbi:Trp family transcriptional regulator [Patescibacteria group bacterium]